MSDFIIPMSKKELDKADIINRSLRKEVTVRKAAKLLSLSKRQVYRLRRKVKKQGPEGLVHGNRGRKSNRRLPKKERMRIVKLVSQHYYDFGPTLAWEKLKEDHGVKRSLSAIRFLMIEQGLWKPKKRKSPEWRSKRARKDHYGEMIQFDGSYHPWFEDRGPKCCLLAAIDDAANIVTARFVDHEGTLPVFSFWRDYLLTRGKPHSIYLDRLRTYTNNGVSEEERKEMLTQFERGMKEMGIKTISSHSPQARGRVERAFGTLQDRLVKEMRLAGISSKKEGSAFLEEYLPEFNQRFAKEPKKKNDIHRQLTEKEKKTLPSVFSRQKRRTVKNDFTIRFKNTHYQLTETQPVTVKPRDRIVVEERFDGTLWFRLRGRHLNYQVLPQKPPNLGQHSWIIPASRREPVEAKS